MIIACAGHRGGGHGAGGLVAGAGRVWDIFHTLTHGEFAKCFALLRLLRKVRLNLDTQRGRERRSVSLGYTARMMAGAGARGDGGAVRVPRRAGDPTRARGKGPVIAVTGRNRKVILRARGGRCPRSHRGGRQRRGWWPFRQGSPRRTRRRRSWPGTACRPRRCGRMQRLHPAAVAFQRMAAIRHTGQPVLPCSASEIPMLAGRWAATVLSFTPQRCPIWTSESFGNSTSAISTTRLLSALLRRWPCRALAPRACFRASDLGSARAWP